MYVRALKVGWVYKRNCGYSFSQKLCTSATAADNEQRFVLCCPSYETFFICVKDVKSLQIFDGSYTVSPRYNHGITFTIQWCVCRFWLFSNKQTSNKIQLVARYYIINCVFHSLTFLLSRAKGLLSWTTDTITKTECILPFDWNLQPKPKLISVQLQLKPKQFLWISVGCWEVTLHWIQFGLEEISYAMGSWCPMQM